VEAEWPLFFPVENFQKKGAEKKTADVRPPGNADGLAACQRGTEELHEKPEPQEKEGRDLDKPGNEEQRNEGQNSGHGIEKKIRAHNPGNSATGPDRRHWGVWIEQDVRYAGSQSTKDIKKEIPPGAEAILNIIAKDIKKPHIAEEMPETAMKKHGGEEGCDRLPAAEKRYPFRISVTGGNKGIPGNKGTGGLALGHLQSIKKHIEKDKKNVDERKMAGSDGVANRNHGEGTSSPLYGPGPEVSAAFASAVF